MIPVALALAAAMPTVAQMRDHRRVLVIAAPTADDPWLRKQRGLLATWHQGAAERDLSLVEVIGSMVTGAGDRPAVLRTRYRLAPDRFTVLLIGKDGHQAYRSSEPFSADRLQGLIDAMPMRRAGLR